MNDNFSDYGGAGSTVELVDQGLTVERQFPLERPGGDVDVHTSILDKPTCRVAVDGRPDDLGPQVADALFHDGSAHVAVSKGRVDNLLEALGFGPFHSVVSIGEKLPSATCHMR